MSVWHLAVTCWMTWSGFRKKWKKQFVMRVILCILYGQHNWARIFMSDFARTAGEMTDEANRPHPDTYIIPHIRSTSLSIRRPTLLKNAHFPPLSQGGQPPPLLQTSPQTSSRWIVHLQLEWIRIVFDTLVERIPRSRWNRSYQYQRVWTVPLPRPPQRTKKIHPHSLSKKYI